jgi:hypothetical protein
VKTRRDGNASHQEGLEPNPHAAEDHVRLHAVDVQVLVARADLDATDDQAAGGAEAEQLGIAEGAPVDGRREDRRPAWKPVAAVGEIEAEVRVDLFPWLGTWRACGSPLAHSPETTSHLAGERLNQLGFLVLPGTAPPPSPRRAACHYSRQPGSGAESALSCLVEPLTPDLGPDPRKPRHVSESSPGDDGAGPVHGGSHLSGFQSVARRITGDANAGVVGAASPDCSFIREFLDLQGHLSD